MAGRDPVAAIIRLDGMLDHLTASNLVRDEELQNTIDRLLDVRLELMGKRDAESG